MKLQAEDLLHVVLIGLITLFLCGCGATGSDSAAASAGDPVSGVPVSPGVPGTLSPGPVTVKVRNALVGQIRQIAQGSGGWTWIVSNDLQLDCTAVTGTEVLCTAYASDPSAYTTVAP